MRRTSLRQTSRRLSIDIPANHHECDRYSASPKLGRDLILAFHAPIHKDHISTNLKKLTNRSKEARRCHPNSAFKDHYITVDMRKRTIFQRFQTEGFTNIVSMASLGQGLLDSEHPKAAINSMQLNLPNISTATQELLSIAGSWIFLYAPRADLGLLAFVTDNIGDSESFSYTDPHTVRQHILSRAFTQGLVILGMASLWKAAIYHDNSVPGSKPDSTQCPSH